jgi:phage gpG-like protein
MSSQYSHPFKGTLKDFGPYLRRLPLRISQRAVLEIKNNFTREGYESDSGRFIKWDPRQQPDKNKSRRALLVLKGRLKRSIKAAPLPNMPRVITDVPYAEPLNDGFRGTQYVKPHKRTTTIKRKVTGGYSGLGVKTRSSTLVMQGNRHNVKGHSRRVNIKARPFMTVGPSFLNREESKLLDELENIFLRS